MFNWKFLYNFGFVLLMSDAHVQCKSPNSGGMPDLACTNLNITSKEFTSINNQDFLLINYEIIIKNMSNLTASQATNVKFFNGESQTVPALRPGEIIVVKHKQKVFCLGEIIGIENINYENDTDKINNAIKRTVDISFLPKDKNLPKCEPKKKKI